MEVSRRDVLRTVGIGAAGTATGEVVGQSVLDVDPAATSWSPQIEINLSVEALRSDV